ncbi:hypothetical protein N7527_003878, partial [Penicillium freii]
LSVIFWDPQTLRETISELTEDSPGSIQHRTVFGNWKAASWDYLVSRHKKDELAAKDSFVESHLAVLGLYPVTWSDTQDRAPLAALIARLSYLRLIEFLVENDFLISLRKLFHSIIQNWPQTVGTNLPSLKTQTSPRVKDRMSDNQGIDFNLLRQ